MKKILSFIVFCVFITTSSTVFAAAGSCTQAVTDSTDLKGQVAFKVLTFVCTWGTAGDATTDLTATLTAGETAELRTWFLLTGSTYNGATAPTALYDLVLRETVGATADAVDILGTAGMNRPGTAGVSSQFTPITDTTYMTTGLRPVLNTLKLTASGNSVASGNATIQFIFVK